MKTFFQNTHGLPGVPRCCRCIGLEVAACLSEEILPQKVLPDLQGAVVGGTEYLRNGPLLHLPWRGGRCAGESCAPAAASLAPKPGVTRGADDAETIPQVGNEGQGACASCRRRSKHARHRASAGVAGGAAGVCQPGHPVDPALCKRLPTPAPLLWLLAGHCARGRVL